MTNKDVGTTLRLCSIYRYGVVICGVHFIYLYIGLNYALHRLYGMMYQRLIVTHSKSVWCSDYNYGTTACCCRSNLLSDKVRRWCSKERSCESQHRYCRLWCPERLRKASELIDPCLALITEWLLVVVVITIVVVEVIE